MQTIRTLVSGGPFPIRRVGRRLFWGNPVLYRWVGVLRDRGDCLRDGFEVWMGGYPRSANTFAVAAFKLANPAVTIASHWHIPAFVINGLRSRKPGIFLIRRPTDSVISWTLFWEGRMKLEDALDYYMDFHRAMLPYRVDLFIAPFEETISDFGGLLQRFNKRFGTQYKALPADARSASRCVGFVEDWLRAPDGSLNELIVSRPSPKRAAMKPKLLEALRNSPRLTRKLEEANHYYERFCQGAARAVASKAGTRAPAKASNPMAAQR